MAIRRLNHEGSLSQLPSGSWRAQITLDGRRIGKSFKKQAQARDWLREMANQKAGGLNIDAYNTTVSKIVDLWYKTKTKLRPNTRALYERTIRLHLKPLLGARKLADLTPLIIQDAYNKFIVKKPKQRTLEIMHSDILRPALDYALKYSIITRNPAELVDLPQVPTTTNDEDTDLQVWNETQVSSFMVVVAGHRNENLYRLALTTGMRIGEICGLQWTDVDWLDSTIRVQRQVTRHPSGRGWSFAAPKTKNARRLIKIGPNLLDALRRQQDLITLARKIAKARWSENDLVFPSTVGNPQHPDIVRPQFQRLSAAAGNPIIRIHDMRHTAATIMLHNGIPLIQVSTILGHAKPSITLDLYGHYLPPGEDAVLLMDNVTSPTPIDVPIKTPVAIRR